MSRVSYSVLDLLKNIEYSDDICGENLSLSKTYDEIKMGCDAFLKFCMKKEEKNENKYN